MFQVSKRTCSCPLPLLLLLVDTAQIYLSRFLYFHVTIRRLHHTVLGFFCFCLCFSLTSAVTSVPIQFSQNLVFSEPLFFLWTIYKLCPGTHRVSNKLLFFFSQDGVCHLGLDLVGQDSFQRSGKWIIVANEVKFYSLESFQFQYLNTEHLLNFFFFTIVFWSFLSVHQMLIAPVSVQSVLVLHCFQMLGSLFCPFWRCYLGWVALPLISFFLDKVSMIINPTYRSLYLLNRLNVYQMLSQCL